MTPPPQRVWSVDAQAMNSQWHLDTTDKGKIGPWLCDLVDFMNLHAQIYVPVELRVTIR